MVAASFVGLQDRLGGELTAVKGVHHSPAVPDENANTFTRRAFFGMSRDTAATIGATAGLTGMAAGSSSSDSAEVVDAINAQTVAKEDQHQELIDLLKPVAEAAAKLNLSLTEGHTD